MVAGCLVAVVLLEVTMDERPLVGVQAVAQVPDWR